MRLEDLGLLTFFAKECNGDKLLHQGIDYLSELQPRETKNVVRTTRTKVRSNRNLPVVTVTPSDVRPSAFT